MQQVQWKMLLELAGLIPLSFLVKSKLNSMGNAHRFPGSIPSGSLIKPMLGIDAKYSWSSLGQFLQVS
jgi:hypothetical protein